MAHYDIPYFMVVWERLYDDKKISYNFAKLENYDKFSSELEMFPEVVRNVLPEQVYPTLLSAIIYLRYEIQRVKLAVMQRSLNMEFDDPYGINAKLEKYFPTKEEIDTLTASKINDSYNRARPDFPNSIHLILLRTKKAHEIEAGIIAEMESMKILDADLIKTYKGSELVAFRGDVLFTGISYIYKEENNQKKVHKTINYLKGKKHGDETLYKYFFDGEEDSGFLRFAKYRAYKYRIRNFNEGKLKSEQYFNKNGKKVGKPLIALFDAD